MLDQFIFSLKITINYYFLSKIKTKNFINFILILILMLNYRANKLKAIIFLIPNLYYSKL